MKNPSIFGHPEGRGRGQGHAQFLVKIKVEYFLILP